MSADKMHLLGSYGDPEPVEMMDDDSSSNDSDNDDVKSETSNEIKPDSNDHDQNIYNGTHGLQNDNNNNNTGVLNSNGINNLHSDFNDTEKLAQCPVDELTEEEQERKRFQIELEFVQSLANPNYLNFLAQRGYFRKQTFLNYLKYLMYWKEPEYVKYIMYPQCLSLLELLQHETFQKEILNAQCSKYIDEQLLLIWLHYKKRRDWIRVNPMKVPDGIEKLFLNTENSIIKNTKKILDQSPPHKHKLEVDTTTATADTAELQEDTFSAFQFLENEKF